MLSIPLALSILLAPAPCAASSASPLPQSLDLPDAGERVQKRILHLTDGRVLRAVARRPADRDVWEVKNGKDWVVLAAHHVDRVANESDVLKQARKLSRGLDRDDLVRRTAYADWLTTQGLLVEAFEELDQILAANPDQPAARALLERAAYPVALPALAPDAPENTHDFLRAAARYGPAGRELAVQRLVAMDEIAGLQDVLLEELVEPNAARRSLATLALRRLLPGRHIRPLLERALLDRSDDVRLGATLALRDANEPAIVAPVVRALQSQSAEIRKHSIQALGAMNYAVAVEPLYNHMIAARASGSRSGAPRSHIFTGRQAAYIQDFDVEVASNSAIADPIINVLTEGQVLEAAVIGTTEYIAQGERSAARHALSRLTGADPGNTTTAWKRWWNDNGGEWMVKKTSPQSPSSPSRRDS